MTILTPAQRQALRDISAALADYARRVAQVVTQAFAAAWADLKRKRGWTREARDVARHFRTLSTGTWSLRQLHDDLTEDSWEDTGQLPNARNRTAAQETQLSFTDVEA